MIPFQISEVAREAIDDRSDASEVAGDLAGNVTKMGYTSIAPGIDYLDETGENPRRFRCGSYRRYAARLARARLYT